MIGVFGWDKGFFRSEEGGGVGGGGGFGRARRMTLLVCPQQWACATEMHPAQMKSSDMTDSVALFPTRNLFNGVACTTSDTPDTVIHATPSRI